MSKSKNKPRRIKGKLRGIAPKPKGGKKTVRK
jgi:hypothetical protein